jgi:hypothetical protein
VKTEGKEKRREREGRERKKDLVVVEWSPLLGLLVTFHRSMYQQRYCYP